MCRSRRIRIRSIALLSTLMFFVMLVLPLPLSAQSNGATLSGTVLDPSGALVPEVKISLVCIGTSIQRQVMTNHVGSFSIPLLEPGLYKLRAVRDGFASIEIPNIILNTNDQRDIQVRLKVGTRAESITVEAESAGVDISAAVSTTVDRRFVDNIPLNGRTFQSLLLMTPGVIMADGDGQMSFNGMRTNANYFTVDGVSANIGVTINPPVMMTSGNGNVNPDQKFAGSIPGFNSTGTTNNLISVDALEEFKVQTSTYSAEYGRQSGGQVQMTSRSGKNAFHGSGYDYLRNDILDARNWFLDPAAKKPPLRQNDYGFTVGGPIIKNKTFFFWSYEALRLLSPQDPRVFNVPGRTIWVNNQIVQFRDNPALNPLLRQMISAFPAPTGPENTQLVTDPSNPSGPKISVPSGSAQYQAAWSNPRNVDTYSLRIDHTLNSWLTLFGRLNIAPSNSIILGTANQTATEVNTKTYTFGATAQLGSRITNQFTANYSSNQGNSLNQPYTGFGGATFDPLNILPKYASPDSVFSYSLPAGVSYSVGPSKQNRMRQWNFVDNLTYTFGQHSLKLGFDYRYLFPKSAPYDYMLNVYLNDAGRIFNGYTASGVTCPAPCTSTVYVYANDAVTAIYKNFSAYAEDHWRVSPKLSLDLGVRWEVNPAPHASGDIPITTVMNAYQEDLSQMKLAPPGTPMYPTIWKAFAPRLGVAYQLRGRPGWETMLRGGYGLFYDLGSGTSGVSLTQFPFSRNRTTSNVAFPFAAGDTSIAPPAPLSMTPPFSNQYFTAFDPRYTLPRTHQWNFTLAQSLGKDQTLTVSYVGNAGRRLLRRYAYRFPTGAASINADFAGDYLSYNTNSPKYADSSDYNALQVQFQRRLSHGLQALSNYTWAHAIDTGSDDFTSNFFQTGNSPTTTRGNSSFDRRQIFNAAVTYDLPRLKGDSPAMKVLKSFVNEWSSDFIFKAQTGSPVTPTYSRYDNNFNLYIYRMDTVPGAPLYIPDPNGGGGQRLNPAAFAVPSGYDQYATTRNGNVARNGVFGVGAWQLDFAIRREFVIKERVRLQIRGEFFNIFNHPNFGPPAVQWGYVMGSGSGVMVGRNSDSARTGFGRPSNMLGTSFYGAGGSLNSMYAIGMPRNIQLVARVSF